MTKIILTALLSLLVAAPGFAEPVSAEGVLTAGTDPRNVFEVPYTDAEEIVAAALNQKGVSDKIAVTISGRRNTALFAYEKPTTIEVKGLQFDKNSNHWSASLLFVADGEVVSALPANGRFNEILEVPVLKREVRNGDIISESDIEIRDIPVKQTRPDMVTNISDLVGKTPVRSISGSRPVRIHEVSNPAVVKKNALVDIHYNSPGMQITATGQALNDGAKGDVIDIRNTTSKKIIRAVVFDSKTVQIMSPNMTTSELTGVGYAAY